MSTTVPDPMPIEREIAQAREGMGRSLFLIADRVAPKKVIARVKEKAAAKADELKANLNPANALRRRRRDPRRVIAAKSRELR